MHRDPAQTALLREIILRGPVTRSELAARTGLSLPSLTRLLKGALEAGLVREDEEVAAGGRGRPTRPLSFNPAGGYSFGVKLTGDDATVVAVDLGGHILASAVENLPSHDPTQVAEQVARMITTIRGRLPQAGALLGVGVGVAGSVTTSGVVRRGTFLGWRDVDFATILSQYVDVPVVVENDVVALTTYEHWFGVARGLQHFAVVTIGTGIGHGLVVFDQVVSGPDAGVGLVGHLPLDTTGPPCHMGHRGCASSLLTLDALGTRYSLATQRARTFADLMDGYRAGDRAAGPIMEAAADALGKLIALAANLDICTTVVLAGEAIDIWDAAGDQVRSAIARWRDPDATAVDVRVERAGFTVWGMGAAALALQEAFTPQR